MREKRWRCKANGEMATELPKGRGINRPYLKLRLDEPTYAFGILWPKHVIYVDPSAWEIMGTVA